MTSEDTRGFGRGLKLQGMLEAKGCYVVPASSTMPFKSGTNNITGEYDFGSQ